MEIDPSTGVLTTTVVLDREQTPSLQFTVVARDWGDPPRSGVAMVTVYLQDLNDHAPQFSQGGAVTVRLPENAQPGFLLQPQVILLEVFGKYGASSSGATQDSVRQ